MSTNPKIETLRQDFSGYLEHSLGVGPGARAWRLACYDQGLEYAGLIDRDYFPLAGRTFLDMAAGWGGHALAFAAYGCSVTASDLNDFSYQELDHFVAERGLDFRTILADCQNSPLPDNTCDVILALELIEHIPDPDALARETARLLKPGGVCVISTPPRLRAIYEGEPHFGLRGLALLPFALQGPVARHIFRASYPFPITRQYTLSSSVARPFVKHGLVKHVRLSARAARWAQRSALFKRAMEATHWQVIVLQKPGVNAGLRMSPRAAVALQ